MREIKFRGKRKDIDWKYGYLTIIEKAHEPNLTAIKPIDEQWITYGVDPESVGEYTGLKDKNGKEIYEGDILTTDSGGVYVVVWIEMWAGFFREVKTASSYEPNGLAFQPMRDIHNSLEVIGNIYESRGLLEQDDQ